MLAVIPATMVAVPTIHARLILVAVTAAAADIEIGRNAMCDTSEGSFAQLIDSR